MNKTESAVELKSATSRLLRWRIPLFLALIANIGVLARMAFVPVGAVAAQPTIALTSAATHQPSGNSTDIGPAAQNGMPPTSPETVVSDIAKHALSASKTESRTHRTSGVTATPVKPLPTTVANGDKSTDSTGTLKSPEQERTTDVSEYVPALTELATNWWPVVESAAQAAERLAAAQQPQTGALAISNLQQNGVPVSFLVDGRVYTLHPGESHGFPAGTSWNLQFHRGGPFGNARESLTPGEYQFVVGTEGWTLQPSP